MDTPPADLSPTKRALLALKQLQAKVEELEYAQHEPIAMIGIGCRFPGEVESPDAFWQLMQQQGDAIGDVPDDRWKLKQATGSVELAEIMSRQGGFMPHLFEFDAAFFRIAPREAVSLDPQQRLLLEVSWEALEQAGIAADRLVGSNTGVFVGICSIDHWQRLLNHDPANIDAYLTTGNTHSLAAGRISYVLGLTGPSMALDAACASSLVAVHTACQSLRQRDCDLALAGGVNRILEPETSLNFAKARMLSNQDRCRSFDAAADGFVRSEGCGVVVLKRWRDAVRDGDSIWAVILGSAVNHDGRASGLTVPNGSAQQSLIRQALQQSRVTPNQVSYIETHGTGTALGDPIEANALAEVFAERPIHQPLMLGAVKTNIGHTEAAAGIAGLIKTVLALHHQEIPANLHFQKPNPQIDWQALPLKVPTTAIPWPQQASPRIAGVSAFGFSGTNAHLVVADRPVTLPAEIPVAPEADPVASTLQLFTLSAKTEAALRELIDRYCRYLQQHPDTDLVQLCYTTYFGRCHWNYRLAILASSIAEVQQKLTQLTLGQQPANLLQGRTVPAAELPPPVDTSPSAWAAYYIQGGSLEDAPLFPRYRPKLSLPTYPFQRQTYRLPG